jgi:hypothetical protein
LRHYGRTPLTLLLGAALLPIASPSSADTGPSSSQTPYLVPTAPGVEFVSILTTGDAVKKSHKGNEFYRMVGIPDGLGALDNGDGTITVLMNHELAGTAGVPRDHGGTGAFVSKWQVRKSDLKVLRGGDLIQQVLLWDGNGYVEAPGAVFSRFCSADLPAPTAFFNRSTGLGFAEGRIFTNGEEAGPTGRAFAHLAFGRQHGTSYELPRLGRFSRENSLASSHEQDKTVVAGLDDTTGGEVYFYVGTKQGAGSPIEQAGLDNGTLYTLAIDGYATEPPVGFPGARFTLETVEEPAFAGGDPDGTGLSRPEDGAWDPSTPNRFYFVTTASFSGNSRLWRVTFDDIEQPEHGGFIDVVIDGASRDIKMMDNITVDAGGDVYMQEDVGNNARLGRIWRYSPGTDALTKLAEHDPSRFLIGGSQFLTEDEESSGIIEVTDLFAGTAGYDVEHNRYFLLDVQAHYALGGELVEGGQLLLMKAAK